MSAHHRAGTGGRRERGFVAVELALGVGLLVLPVALLVLTLPDWSERQVTARAIAREAARLVTASGTCATAAVDSLGVEMARNLGVPSGDVAVALGCRPGIALEPGSDVEVAVTVHMPAVHLPGVGDVGEWAWTARHRQAVDRYGEQR